MRQSKRKQKRWVKQAFKKNVAFRHQFLQELLRSINANTENRAQLRRTYNLYR